jgi:hypothetical protein
MTFDESGTSSWGLECSLEFEIEDRSPFFERRKMLLAAVAWYFVVLHHPRLEVTHSLVVVLVSGSLQAVDEVQGSLDKMSVLG